MLGRGDVNLWLGKVGQGSLYHHVGRVCAGWWRTNEVLVVELAWFFYRLLQ